MAITMKRSILYMLLASVLIVVMYMLNVHQFSITVRIQAPSNVKNLSSVIGPNNTLHKDGKITGKQASSGIDSKIGSVNTTKSSVAKLKNLEKPIQAIKTKVFYGKHLLEGVAMRRTFEGSKTSKLKRSPKTVVPTVVHYVWFGKNPLRFHHMLSMISAYKYIKPEKLFIHCDVEPYGKWWDLVKKNITTLVVNRMTPPSMIFGNAVRIPEHKSDVVRLEMLMKYGGIYLDFDVFALKSFEELLHYDFTMGVEYHGRPGRLNNGIIIARSNSTFLRLWHESYHYFRAGTRNWDYQSCIVPYYMQYEFPKLIHVEEKALNYPSGLQTHLIYRSKYDWSKNYAMHLWYRSHNHEYNPEVIKRIDTTFGQMARHIFYGSKELI